MSEPPVPARMSNERARECFDAALDGELEPDERAAFDAALAADEGLRADYDAHGFANSALGSLGTSESVDLLPGLQERLRRQSGGKYYRDRFSEKQGTRGSSVLIAACSALVLIALLWLANETGVLFPDVPK